MKMIGNLSSTNLRQVHKAGRRFVVYFWSNSLHSLVVHIPQMLLPFFIQNFRASRHGLTIHIHDYSGEGFMVSMI